MSRKFCHLVLLILIKREINSEYIQFEINQSFVIKNLIIYQNVELIDFARAAFLCL